MHTLPLTAPASASRSFSTLPATTQVGQKRFIIIDDDDVFLLLHPRFLSKFLPGCQVTGFIDPAQGLRALCDLVETASPESEPCVLLLDLRMPGLSGWDVLDRLMLKFSPDHIRASLQIFLLTSSDDPTDRRRAAGYPIVQGYLVKPLTQQVVMKYFAQAEAAPSA